MADIFKPNHRGVKFFSPRSIDASHAHSPLLSPSSPRIGVKESRTPSQIQPQGITTQTPKYEKELDRNYKDMNYFALADLLRSQLVPKQRMHHLKTYPNTLLGSDITKWLISSCHAITIDEAEYLGTGLMEHGHIYNVIDEDTMNFEGGGQLYRFCIDDRVQFNLDALDFDEVGMLLSRCTKKRDVEIGNTTLRDVLSGSHIVDIILQKGLVSQRLKAVEIAQKMLENHYLVAVQTKLEFIDHGECFYFLNTDLYPGSAIPPPNGTDVSELNLKSVCSHEPQSSSHWRSSHDDSHRHSPRNARMHDDSEGQGVSNMLAARDPRKPNLVVDMAVAPNASIQNEKGKVSGAPRPRSISSHERGLSRQRARSHGSKSQHAGDDRNGRGGGSSDNDKDDDDQFADCANVFIEDWGTKRTSREDDCDNIADDKHQGSTALPKQRSFMNKSDSFKISAVIEDESLVQGHRELIRACAGKKSKQYGFSNLLGRGTKHDSTSSASASISASMSATNCQSTGAILSSSAAVAGGNRSSSRIQLHWENLESYLPKPSNDDLVMSMTLTAEDDE